MAPAFVTAEEAARWIQPGDTVASVGFTMIGVAEEILAALERRFLSEGQPRDLTLVHSAGQSDRVRGIAHLAHPGLLKRVIGSHWGLCPPMAELIAANDVEVYCLPQGQMTHLYRATAAGQPGVLSRTGLGTLVDPRLEGGRINERSRDLPSPVELMTLGGREFLFYRAFPINVTILRGTTADEKGNISMDEECLNLEALAAAQAARRWGGKVIAQVKRVARAGSLPARQVTVPWYMVDAIVVCSQPETSHRQSAGFFFDPYYNGTVQPPLVTLAPIPLTVRKVIGRRAVAELRPGSIVNLGTGIPGDTVGPVLAEQGRLGDVTLTIESGTVGGVPAGGTDFGISRGPEAILEHAAQFDYYTGTGVDFTFMGAAQIDATGSVNVSKFGKRAVGCGGFIDITQSARNVVFCLTFTAGDAEIAVEDGRLQIRREGDVRKFVRQLTQTTFSGRYAVENRQCVLYVTERAVFRLTAGGLLLEEIAPGLDLQRDILAHMEFVPEIASDLRTMDPALFTQ